MKYANTPPRKNVGSVDFRCPNCDKSFHRTLWEEQDENEDDPINLVHADALCSCGAQILVADTLERLEVYWLNEQKMKDGGVRQKP